MSILEASLAGLVADLVQLKDLFLCFAKPHRWDFQLALGRSPQSSRFHARVLIRPN